MDVLILRDPRESVAKCSLTPVRDHPDLRFVAYDPERRVQAGCRLLLHPEGAELGEADRGKGLLLVDCSWRRVDKLLRVVDGDLERRRVSGWQTAYPRRSRTFEDPAAGLASIEALFAALVRLEGPRPELLEGYRWRDAFLERNRRLID